MKNAGHLDIVGEEWEGLKRDSLVFVIANDVLHHEVGREGLSAAAIGELVAPPAGPPIELVAE